MSRWQTAIDTMTLLSIRRQRDSDLKRSVIRGVQERFGANVLPVSILTESKVLRTLNRTGGPCNAGYFEKTK